MQVMSPETTFLWGVLVGATGMGLVWAWRELSKWT